MQTEANSESWKTNFQLYHWNVLYIYHFLPPPLILQSSFPTFPSLVCERLPQKTASSFGAVAKFSKSNNLSFFAWTMVPNFNGKWFQSFPVCSSDDLGYVLVSVNIRSNIKWYSKYWGPGTIWHETPKCACQPCTSGIQIFLLQVFVGMYFHLNFLALSRMEVLGFGILHPFSQELEQLLMLSGERKRGGPETRLL